MTTKPNLKTAITLSFLLASLLAPGGGQAAAKDDAKRGASAEAKDAVRRGVELLGKRDYAGALAAFREAHEISPTPMTTAQIGFVHMGMGRWLEAQKELEEALLSTADPWVAEHQAELRASLDTARSHIGSLRVQGTPEGAEVRFRGEVVGLLSMRSPVQVTTGPGSVEVRMTGFEPAQRPIGILPREVTEVHLALQPLAVAAPPAPRPLAGAHARAPSPPAAQPAPAPAPTPGLVVPAEQSVELDHLSALRAYRLVGTIAGVVLLGAGIPLLVWNRQNRPASRSSSDGDLAVAGIASGAIAVGGAAMVLGVGSWIALGIHEAPSAQRASLKSPVLMLGGRF